MTPRLTINESEHATPGYVVATARSASPAIVWRGPFADLQHARGYDAIHCHPSDGAKIRAAAARKNILVREAA
ncbi:hypothetical protein GJ654_18605 [Rhodoblastus acidophilus]|uniref:Uncharacterized protein n=1 Tax=Rhodoblastus acidophilus TaxID=1074 RepID=A0A6N8DTV8_RHOAC|nr:hypothetical protein [Rhodoblastus acidophilus]MCW2276338.1 hypothetical protein [Rhodoblastus acidophilus]MTV32995.1 hypothetical protein [Rhodoblastus acidophilus]